MLKGSSCNRQTCFLDHLVWTIMTSGIGLRRQRKCKTEMSQQSRQTQERLPDPVLSEGSKIRQCFAMPEGSKKDGVIDLPKLVAGDPTW